MTDDRKITLAITLAKLDEDGEEIPTTIEEQTEALRVLRQALAEGRIEFTDAAWQSMQDKGFTVEQIEAWFSELN